MPINTENERYTQKQLGYLGKVTKKHSELALPFLQIGSLEAYTEAIPQFVILTAMAITEGAMAHCNDIPFGFISNGTELLNKTCVFGSAKMPITIQNIPFYTKFGLTQNILSIPSMKIPMYFYFRMTYYTTLVSCGCGIARFLEVGPTRILPKDGWKNFAGYGLTVIIVIYSLYTKALGIGSDGTTMTILLDLFGVKCPSSKGNDVCY